MECTLVDLATQARYVALPFSPTPARFGVVSAIMRELLKFETIFTDYTRGCDEICGECERCRYALAVIARMMARTDTIAWEVWSDDEEPTLAGVVYLTDVVAGENAICHYCFFDRKLVDKTALLEELAQWCFSEHEGWEPLRRLSLEIPDFAFTLARHAYTKLGFGGDFVRMQNGKSLRLEGVRKAAFRWRGVDRDLLLLGRVRA